MYLSSDNKANSHSGPRIILGVTLLLITQLFNIQTSYAQRVEPMVFELASSGKNSTTSLRIKNNKSSPLTLEVEPSRISLDEFGNETRTLAEDDFLIYPPQTIVQPGKTQVIKVRYIGDPTIDVSQAYRISVKQLPVDLDLNGASGVGLLLNFNTLANVTPAKAKAELSVSNIEQGDDGNWNITIKNSGNLFARLAQTSWAVSSTTDASKEKKINKEEVSNIIAKKLILPNSILRTTMKAIEGFSPESTNIVIIQ